MIADVMWETIETAGPGGESPALFDPPFWLYADSAERDAAEYQRRRTFIANFAWSVPTREAIQTIVGFTEDRSLLEVCAGSGLWASLLCQAGVDVLATDAYPSPGKNHFPVEAAEAEAAVIAHPDRRSLMMSWPPYKTSCAYRALSRFRGDRLIYIGDVRFTADAAFHRLLAEHWDLRQQLPLPSWPGLRDGLYLYARVG